MNERPIVVALDHASAAEAHNLAARLDPARCRLKVGKRLFVSAGPPLVERLVRRGFDLFLDLKFHDIPSTVAGACRAAADLGVWMVNVHAAGGRAMLQAARASLADAEPRPLLTAVTVLTSLERRDLEDIGMADSPLESARRLAGLAHACGLDGVVCSAAELGVLAAELPPGFLLVTPGIRPQGSDPGDQKRTLTPAAAARAGASYLVVGRPITAAPDPLRALAEIEEQIRTR